MPRTSSFAPVENVTSRSPSTFVSGSCRAMTSSVMKPFFARFCS
jgi:hypothetical protein